jgi:hypothetical protein
MLVTRESIITGKVHELDLPITQAEALAYKQGKLIQDAFPNLTDAEREFIKTGITPEEWEAAFGKKE